MDGKHKKSGETFILAHKLDNYAGNNGRGAEKTGAGRDGFFSCVKRNDTAVLYTGRKKWEKFCVFGRFRAHTEGQQRTFKAARDDTG